MKRSYIPEVYVDENKKQEEVERMVSHAFELLAPHLCGTDNALDVAVGQGCATVRLAKRVKTVHAIDPRASSVEGIRKLIQNEGLSNVEAYAPISVTNPFPFPNETFDVATNLLGTALFPNFRFLFKEVGRVLRQNGRYAIITAVFSENIREIWLTIARLAGAPILFYPTYFDILDAFDSAHLKIEIMRPSFAKRCLSEFLTKIEDSKARERLRQTILEDVAIMKEMSFSYSEKEKDWVFFFNTLEILAIKEPS